MSLLDDVKQYTPLVQKIVSSFYARVPANIEYDDLFAAGNLGLLQALRGRASENKNFMAYAYLRIRGAIVDELRSQDYLSTHQRRNVLAGKSTMKVSFIEDLDQRAWQYNEPRCEILIEDRTALDALHAAIGKLPPREACIVTEYYLGDTQLVTLARRFRVSQQRVTELRIRALKLLRDALDEDADKAR